MLPFPRLHSPGEDIHYGGTIPMNDKNIDLGCDLNGELKDFKNIYISDASSLAFMPGKTHTFNSIAQSMLITEKAIKNE